MSSYTTRDKVEELVTCHPDVVHFGSEEDSVGDDWINKAERRLGLTFSESYRWFLKKYSGGEIGSEEIYSIYGVDFESANGGDVVYQHLIGLKNNLVNNKMLVISETDFGEVYFFDYSDFKGEECPVRLRLPSGNSIPYSSDFYEFLYKRILAHL